MGSGPERKQNRPNVLFIAVDDLYTSIGYTKDLEGSFLKILYPDPVVRARVASRLTPNIDRLAAEGRHFVNATCQSPLCGPSRTSLLTGIPTHASGYYMHHESFRATEGLEQVVTLPLHLKNNGYFTTGVGKIFHSPKVKGLNDEDDWPDSRYSWNKWISNNAGAGLGNAKLPPLSPTVSNMKFGPGNQPTEETNDWQNAHFTSTLLQHGTASLFDIFTEQEETVTLPEDQPFFVASGIFRPHLPFYAPKSFFELFPTSEMKVDHALYEQVVNDIQDLPPAGVDWTQLTSGKFHEIISQGAKIGGEEGQLEAWKQCIQAYLACVAFADQCVGEILSGLEASRYRDNTIVVLWSDHGYFLGNKARIAKQSLWWEAIKSNLIIKVPGNQKQRGTSSLAFAQLTDLYPTIGALCGLKVPDHVMGEDLTPLVMDPEARLKRKYTYATYFEGNHALFNDEFKYIRYQNGDQELYDVRGDAFEYNNLSKDRKYRKVISRFYEELDRQLETGEKLLLSVSK